MWPCEGRGGCVIVSRGPADDSSAARGGNPRPTSLSPRRLRMARQRLSWRGGRPGSAAALLAAAAVLAARTGADAGGKGKGKSEVKLTATATKPDADGRQTVTVTMVINKGWYAYANPVGLEDLKNAETTVKIAAKNKLE